MEGRVVEFDNTPSVYLQFERGNVSLVRTTTRVNIRVHHTIYMYICRVLERWAVQHTLQSAL